MASDELSRGVPDHVKHHKAALICSKTTRAIATIKDAWPKRPIGWWDERCRKMIDYDLELVDDYGEPLKLPITDEEAEAVSRRDILKAFDQVGFRVRLYVP